MTMIQATALGHGRDDGTRPQRGGVRRGRRLLRRRVPLHRGAAGSSAPSRCFDAPISESGIVGAADRHGRLRPAPGGRDPVRRLRLPGLRPDRVRGAAALPLATGDFTAPITIRMPCGGGIYGGQTHSQSPEALFTHVCGLRTVMPSATRYDAKGLLIAAIECDDPVIFLEPKRLYNGPFDGHHDRPGGALEQAPAWARCPRATTRCRWTRPRSVPARHGGHGAGLRHHGLWREAAARRPASTPRSSTCAASGRSTSTPSSPRSRRPGAASSCTRPRAPRGFGAELSGPGAGALLLPPGSADRARDGLGHALPARPGMGLLPRTPDARRRGAASARWRAEPWAPTSSRCPTSARASPRRSWSPGSCSRRRVVTEDQILADVMTDKATVEIPSPVPAPC
jgi:hypothetical protein